MSGTTWVLLPVLLSTLLCIYPAHSLHCYNCTGVKKTSQCQPVLCSKFATRCGSLKAGDQDGPDHKRLHFKGCADVSCEGFFKELWDKAYIEIPASLMAQGFLTHDSCQYVAMVERAEIHILTLLPAG